MKLNTVPLAKFYRDRGLLISIWADGTPEEIFKRTLDALDDRLGDLGALKGQVPQGTTENSPAF